jgi:hypothetical protein
MHKGKDHSRKVLTIQLWFVSCVFSRMHFLDAFMCFNMDFLVHINLNVLLLSWSWSNEGFFVVSCFSEFLFHIIPWHWRKYSNLNYMFCNLQGIAIFLAVLFILPCVAVWQAKIMHLSRDFGADHSHLRKGDLGVWWFFLYRFVALTVPVSSVS